MSPGLSRLLLAVLLVAGLASRVRAGSPAFADSLASRLQGLIADGHAAVADSVARSAIPELLRLGDAGGPHMADASDAAIAAMLHTGVPMPLRTDSLAARAVGLRRRGGDSLALARSLDLQAEMFLDRTAGRLALQSGEEALRLMITHAPRDSDALAAVDLMLGRASAMLEDSKRAERYFRSALAIQERRLGADHPQLANAWMGIASAAWSRNDPAESARLYEKALALVERQSPPSPSIMLVTLQGLMQSYSTIGDLPRARRFGERAVAFADSACGPLSRNTGWAHSRFADVLGYLGDVVEAHRQAELGVAIGRRAYITPNLLFASTLKISGECFYDMHALDSAAVRISEAIGVRESVTGLDDAWAIHARARLAVVEGERGHPARALGVIQPLWPLAVAQGGRWRLILEDDLARVHRLLGQHSVADSLLRHLVAADDSAAGPRSPITLTALQHRAECRYDMGDRTTAFALAHAVQQVSRGVLSDAISQLADRDALACEGEQTRGVDLMLTMASDRRGLAPAERLTAWDAVMRTRLAVLSERAEERRSIRAGDPEVERRRELLAVARDSLARLSVRALGAGRSDSLAARLEEARRRRDEAERALAEVSRSYRESRPAVRADIHDALAALPADAALVSYVRFAARRTPVAADSGLGSPSRQRYLALVRAPGSADVAVVPLGDARELEDLIARWSERSAHPLPPADTVAWRRYRDLGARVRERIWDPVRARLGAAGRVFVVPDGALANVNLLALPVGRDAWLAESGSALEMLGTESDLVRRNDAAPSGHGLLALGDPAFGLPADAARSGEPVAANVTAPLRSVLRDADSLSLAPLPGSGEEVNSIADLWRSLDAARGDARALTGAQATEEAFKAQAPGRLAVHLATHSASLAGRRVSFEPGVRGVGGVRPATAPQAPESRDDLAGLALAGAGRRDTSGVRDDGWLTSEEVLSLDLTGVDWAVLSACESGAGDPRARESVQGLVRAFRLAGARTVIASLWQVDDRATREWMARVYRAHWQAGMATADAVRAACRETIAARRARGESTHPFYWGAFVATGSGR